MAHTLKYLHRPSKLMKVRYNMREHSEFLITSGALMDFYCDLGGCIIQASEPYLVAKIHGFRTQVNEPRLQKKNEDERQRWLHSIADDHTKMVAKVPGLNIYLELQGSMDEEDTCMERWHLEKFDRSYIVEEATKVLNRMATFYRSVLTKGDAQTYATQETDWQPREDWQEMYDPNEYFRRPDRHGIGFDLK